MSVLYLVRHGQASVHAEDYDELSPLGEEQGRALGEHWAGTAERFDLVYLGPLRRHRQTYDAVASAYRRAGLPWPNPTPMPELDEHHGPEVITHHRTRLMAEAGLIDPAEEEDVGKTEVLRRYLTIYKLGTRQWIRDDLETPPGLEPWADFRRRVASGLDRTVNGGDTGQRIVAFTSGGATAAAVGTVLGIGDEKVLELSWRVRNAAVTEVLFSRGRLSLETFNTTPHLREKRLLTYI